MTTIVRRNQNWLPSVFNDLFDAEFASRRPNFSVPAINVKESDRRYTVEVAAPGMTKGDFDVRIDEDSNIVITLEKKAQSCDCSDCSCDTDKKGDCSCDSGADHKCDTDTCQCDSGERYLRREFSYSKFQQTMIMPDDVDKDAISAHVEHGILTIELPKYSAEQMTKAQRVIEIG